MNLLFFINFITNFFRISISVCHSFRSWSRFGQTKDFKRCLQLFDHCCRRRQQLNEDASKIAPHFEALSAFCLLSPVWGLLPCLERIEPSYSGILTPVRVSNTKPSLGKVFCRAKNSKSARVELNTSVIEDIFSKAVAFLSGQSRIGSRKNVRKSLSLKMSGVKMKQKYLLWFVTLS